MPPIIAAFAATGALWGGLVGVGAIVATTAGAIIVGGIAGALVGFVFEELLMPDMPDSPTYKSGQPVYTIEEGRPIAKPYGRCKIAGNVIRSNDPGDSNFKIVIGHGHGEIDSLLSWKINSIEWDSLIDVRWYEVDYARSVHWKNTALGTDSQTPIQVNGTDLFSLEACGYRGIAHTGFKLTKNSQIGSFGSVSVEGRFLLCEPIGGGAKIFSRNPAVIMWDFYRNVEGYEITDLDINTFTSLETLCDFCPPVGEGGPIRPPGPNSTTVKATSFENPAQDSHGRMWCPFYAFDVNKAVEGASEYNEWSSAEGQTSGQRLNADLGFPIVLKKIVIVNSHGDLTQGIQHFSIQGSNTAADLDHTAYLDGASGWTNVQLNLTATQYDSNDPYKDYEVTIPKPAYRYYSIKILTNHGDADFMRVRDICFWGRSPRYTFDYNFDSKININDAKKLIWSSFDGRVIRSQGKLKPVWDWSTMADGSGGLTAKTSQYSFTMDNIVKDSFVRLPAKRSNKVTVEYLDSSEGYKKIPITEKDDSDIDNRGEVTLDVKAYYITQRDVAARKCKRLFYRALYSGDQCKLTGFPSSQKLEVYDLVQVTHTIPSWTAKEFVVLSKAEDEYGRPTFLLRPYYTGIFDDVETPISESQPSIFPGAWDIPPSSTGIAVALVGGPGSEYDYRSVKVSFTSPAEYLFYSHTEIYASRDDSTYYLVGTSSGEDFVIQGMGMLYYPGDTCYVKLTNVSTKGVSELMPVDADDSVAISSTIRSANFYLGLNDIWGGNAAINNAATTIVLGNLDGISKIALGATADILDINNMATYPGFFADGQGYFRAGGVAGYVKWDGSAFVIAGTLIASSIHIPDQDTTANSFHVQSDGDTWWGCTETNFNADNDNALAYILKTGIAKFQNIDIIGGTVSGFYVGLYDFWGGNAAISNIATTIVLGNLDGISKIALGATADSLSISNMATYAGFFADGQGYFRGGGANKYIQWNGEITIKAGADFLIDSANQKMTLGSGNDLIALDAADATYRLAIGHATYGSAPFRVTKAGAITAISGTIGGWTLASDKLSAGTDADYIGLIPGIGIQMGDSTFADAEFSVTNAGVLKAVSGMIGGWVLTATTLYSANIVLDQANDKIIVNTITIDGANNRIRSDNYASGYMGAGFNLDPDLLEVGNIACRGIFRTSVFQKDTISVVGGNVLVMRGDVLGADMTANDGIALNRISEAGDTRISEAGDTRISEGLSPLTIEGNESFFVGDILRIKDGNDDEWLEVIGVANAPVYYVIRDKGGDYAADSNPAWTKGAAVVNYGQSGDGGIYMTASESNAPYMSVITHAGSPWDTISTHIRMGNLNGYAGYGSDIYGWAAYIDADNYIKIDPVNGIRITGNLTIAGQTLDDIADGSSYGKINLTSISAGNILLASCSGSLDDLANGTTYGKVLITAISAGKIVLTSSGVSGSLPTSLSDAKCTDATADKTSTHTCNDPWGGHDLDDLANGTYGKVLLTSISAGKIVLSETTGDLDDIANGTYGKVLSATLDSGYLYFLRKSADSTERLEITAGGVEGYANNVKNFELASGIAYLGDQSNEHIKLSSSGLQIKDGATLYATYGSTTTLGLTASEHIKLTSTSVQFKDGANVYTDLTAGVLKLGLVSGGEYIRIDSTGIEGYGGATKRFEITNAGLVYLGDQSNEHIKLSSSGLQIKDGATLYATYGATTTIGLTASEHIAISGSAIQLKDGGTVYTSISGGNILVGQTGAGQSNVYITSGAIQLRNNTTAFLTLSNAGVANLIIKGGGDALFEHGGDIKFTSVIAPGACTATLITTGTGNIDNGTHSYKITFVNDAGETELGSVSNTVTVDATHKQVSLSNIPISSSSSVTKRRIYRTKAGGSDHYWLGVINDNTTTIYTDNIADADLSYNAENKGNDSFGKLYIDGIVSLQLGKGNVFIGYESGAANTAGYWNTGVGYRTFYANTTGYRNAALGYLSLSSNTTGYYNVAMGYHALKSAVSGDSNIGLGFCAGKYELGSDAFYVNNRDRVNTAGDKSKSLLYGIMAVAAANQKLTINALLNLSVSKTPASAGAAGTAGDVAWDTNKIYVCVATNTWKRTALNTW